MIAAAVASVALLAAACGPWVDAPDVGLPVRTVVAGGQAEMDRGAIVAYAGSCWPGDGCPIWLAGHRSTHGAPLRQAADLQPDDQIRLGYGGEVWVYVVDGHDVICCYGDWFEPIADLTVTTSAGGGRIHLVSAHQVDS